MKQTKQFLRPLLMAIVMMVGMLMPQGAWAEELRVDGKTVTISSDASYDHIEVRPGGELIINEGVTVEVYSLAIESGTVINYGTISGIVDVNEGTFANHGSVTSVFNWGGTFYNTGTYDELKKGSVQSCSHNSTTSTGVEVPATCTHGAGTQYRCNQCHYIGVNAEGDPLPHDNHDHNGVIVCSMCGQMTFDGPTVGIGTAESPYQIANAGHLFWLADKVNNDYNNFKDANAVLTADIVVNDGTFAADGTFTATGASEPSTPIEWLIIGRFDMSPYGYRGTFDGQGHTISGLYANYSYSGFVGISAGEGKIKNVGVINSYFDGDRAGGICGYAGDNREISNCYSSNVICKGYYVGGIVGQATSSDVCIINCYSTASLINQGGYENRTGGIAGTINGSTTNCYTTYGNVNGSSRTEINCEANVSLERFASGEIAYKLNGSVDGEGHWTAGATNGTQKWYQKLGENGDSYPVLAAAEGNTVYEQKTIDCGGTVVACNYNNTEEEDVTQPHDYKVQQDENEKPVFVWSEDYTTATLQVVCSHHAEHTANVEVTGEGITSEDTTPATCTATGVRTYTAKATYEGVEYTGTKEVEIPAGHSFVDGVCEVCHATAVAEVKIGETTTGYTDIQDALTAALNEESATLTMLADVEISSSLNVDKNGCVVTIDLNGHKISSSSNVIYLNAGKLTIEDNSIGQTGTMESDNYTTITTNGGSITIHGGTFISTDRYALDIPDNGVIGSLDGGRFISTNSNAVHSSYYTTALADGFAYYNYSSGKELESTIYNIKDENGNPAKDVIVKPASVKATLTIGSETTDCYTFMSAFNAALNTTSPATVTMLVDTDLKKANNDYALSVNNSACDVTIDLNGHKLNRTTGSSVIELSAGSLTITDGSAEKTGVMESNYSTLSVSGGSITIHGGTFISQNSNGLYCYGSYTASLDGGRFISNSTNNSAVETSGSTTALAEGYSYYNFSPLKKLESTTGAIKDEDGNYAKDVTVKLSEPVVPTFASLEELIAADQSFDAVNVTIEDKVQLALLYNGIYMVHLKNSEITLSAPGSDLGWASGGTVTGTLTNVAWNNTYKQLSGEDADFWSGLTCTAPSAGNVPTFASIDELLAANIESGTIVTVTINGTIAEAKYTSGASAYAVKLDNGFVLAVMFKVTSDPEWEVDGTVSGTLENVTFINENGEPGIMCMDRNIFEELTYTAPVVVIADGESYSTAEQYSLPANRVSMARTFITEKPSTVMLPFTVEASQISGATFHEFKGVAYDTEKGEWIATMQKVSTVEAYKPYLVIPTAGSITFGTEEQTVTFPATASSSSNLTQTYGDWTFVALNEFKRWEAGDEEIGKAYGFAGIDKTVDGNAIHRGDFVKIAAGASAKPGRCYLVKNDGEPLTRAAEELPATIKVHFISGSANGIGTLNTETGEMTLEGWYDLNGNKIEQPSKGGVYIHNNKKVMVK